MLNFNDQRKTITVYDYVDNDLILDALYLVRLDYKKFIDRYTAITSFILTCLDLTFSGSQDDGYVIHFDVSFVELYELVCYQLSHNPEEFSTELKI